MRSSVKAAVQARKRRHQHEPSLELNPDPEFVPGKLCYRSSGGSRHGDSHRHGEFD
jgi:hypothetical protein